jgi:hypothetical protein
MLPPGFDVAGWHQAMSGCSLPPSIPEDVLDKLFEHFSRQALDDTHRLLHVPNIQTISQTPHQEKRRQRTDSTQTQPLGTADVGGAAVTAFINYVTGPGLA